MKRINKNHPKGWIQLTKRTADPKLSWLERVLKEAGIASQRRGESFHAPILNVRQCDWEKAWAILATVDDLPDDDPKFNGNQKADHV